MQTHLQGKVVAITGAFGNLGVAVARAAVARGAKVAMIDRAPAPTDASLADLGPHSILLGGVDLTSLDGASAAMAATAARFGGLDALINIAGGFRWQTLEAGDLATWDFMYNVNLRTAATACKAALPHLLARGGGRIVNIGAGAAGKAGAGMGAYAAAKSGVARLTEALSEEVKDRGINVNAVLPSIIDTPPNRADMPDADFSRWVRPEAIAGVIMFLLSDDAKPIVGALIPVSGRS